MSQAMIYLWIIMGGFVLMGVLFVLAEMEVKKLKRQIAEQNENDRFDTVYRQIENEAQEMGRRVRDTNEMMDKEVDGIYRRLNAMEEKIEAHLKRVK
jgi:hypothetical protein